MLKKFSDILTQDNIRKEAAKSMLELFELTVRNTSDINWKQNLLKQIEKWNKDLT